MKKVGIHIKGFNIITGMLAFSALKSGVPVSIEVSKSQLSTSFLPEPSAFFPFHLKQIPHAVKVDKWLRSISVLFPHLFYPVRVVSVFSGIEPNTSYISLVDKIMKRGREEASFPFQISKYKSYSALNKQHYSKGVLAFETRFDRNRSVVELLKLCKENGAFINQPNLGRFEINANAFDINNRLFELNESTPFENQLNVEQDETCASIFKIKWKSFVYLHQYFSEEKVNELLRTIGINSKIEIRGQAQLNEKHINDASLINFPNEYLNLEKTVSNALGRKIDLKNALPKADKNFNFKQVHESCDDHYNLAKQTGVDVLDFNYYFFRYRNQIDWMIERAYDLMSTQRDPLKIWSEVEHELIEIENAGLFQNLL